MDFFTVSTATFRHLYCFFVISYDRRAILHFNTTEHPTNQWVAQQLREAFPEETAPKYLILDRDNKFGGDVPEMLNSLGSRLIRTSYRSPWQNGVAERWVESCRRDLLDHVIVLNEIHLRRLVGEYIYYYHIDLTHDGLGKVTPGGRSVKRRKSRKTELIPLPSLGGLHHRYKWAAAAE
jgi:putative transposase